MSELDALRNELRRLNERDSDILIRVSDLILAVKEHEREITKLNARVAYLEGRL